MQATAGRRHGADMEQSGVFPIQTYNTTITVTRDRDVTFCKVTRQLAKNTELVVNTEVGFETAVASGLRPGAERLHSKLVSPFSLQLAKGSMYNQGINSVAHKK